MEADGRESFQRKLPVFVFTREERGGRVCGKAGRGWGRRRYADRICGSKYEDYLACSDDVARTDLRGRGDPDRRLSAFGQLPAERRTVRSFSEREITVARIPPPTPLASSRTSERPSPASFLPPFDSPILPSCPPRTGPGHSGTQPEVTGNNSASAVLYVCMCVHVVHHSRIKDFQIG